MAKEKDIAEKQLEDHNDIFADIMNVVFFKGEPVVREQELSDAGTRSVLKIDGTLHEQERDVAKFWKSGEVRVALCGFENQTKPDRDMVLRVIGYDGASYKQQVNAHISARRAKKKPRPVYPALTVVLYFGEEQWTAPKSLRECFEVDIPPALDRFVQDYKIHVVEIARMTPAEAALFRSDFRIIADFLVQKRNTGEYTPSTQTIRHTNEVMEMFTAITGDQRFVEELARMSPEEKEGLNMYDILDKAEARGETRGRAAEREALRRKLDENLPH